MIEGRRCLDAGASTGGFTDVLLRAGAARVLAVDVGYGQLVWALQTDDRVTVMDRTNVRGLTLDAIGGTPVDLVVGDLSFISLTLVLPALSAVTGADGDLVLMVKPQFEVGKDRLGKGGVVRDPELRVRRTGGRDGRCGAGLGDPRDHGEPAAGSVGKRRVFPVDEPGAPSLDETMLATAIENGPR